VNRTSLVLGIALLLLGGYVFFVERGSLSTGEIEKRKGSALPQLVRDRITRLEIQRKGVTTVLTRSLEEKPKDEGSISETEDAALWHVEAPYRAKADQAVVDSLLGELEWLDGKRNLGPATAQDRARFGFDKPRARIAFTVGKVQVKVVIGKESPRGDGIYVMTGDPPQVFLAGKDLIEALNQEPGRYHDKELHSGILVMTARAITLRDAQGERGMRKRDDGSWEMSAGADGLASEPVMTDLLHALDELRTQRFVADHVSDLGRYGLGSPRFSFALRRATLVSGKPQPGKEPKREESTLTLLAGAPCEGHPGESYVTIAGSNEVSCASDPDLAKLNKSAAELRESRLLPIVAEDIKSVQLRRGGVQLSLTAAEDGTSWTYALSGGGAPSLSGTARDGSVSDWLKALAAAQVTRFDLPPPATLSQPGAISVEVGRAKDKPTFKLQAVLAGMDLIARRADESHAVAFAASIAEQLTPQAARFRPLALLHLSEPALRSIEITRGGVQERVVRGTGADSWNVVAPQALAADNLIASELARNLSALEVVRFDADTPSPAHALATPAAVVTLTYEESGKPAQRTVLEVGGPADGGRFAQLRGQPGGFVLAARTASLLLDPLVSRSLLATPLEHLREVTLEHAGQREHIVRGEGAFTAAPGGTLTPEAARALAEAVATLRASRVIEYGAASATTGLTHPDAKLDVVADGANGAEQRYTIAIGGDAGDGARYARRSDVAVTFVLPKEACERLLGPSAAAAPAKTPPARK
jgi:hypothetical protein